jgi:16S rRNA (cytosine967-C5)-methyltransferase
MKDLKKVESLAAAANEPEVRNLVLTLWQRARMDWSFLTDHLSSAFRENRALSAHRRRVVAETLYGLVRHKVRISKALELGGLRPGRAAPDLEYLLAFLVLEQHITISDAASASGNIDWQRVANADQVLSQVRDPVERLELTHSLPNWLARLLWKQYAEQAFDLAESLNWRAPMTVRANTLKATRQEVMDAIELPTKAGIYGPASIHFESRVNLFALPAFKKGLFEAQDEGSQLVAEMVMAPPKALVVDLCAGAGGKTLAIAADMENRGRIVATDIYKRKLDELKRRARRAGVDNTQSVVIPADRSEALPKQADVLTGKAHRVLVDAPCSGLGSLRRNPEAKWRLMADAIDRLPELQYQICCRGLELLRPGGRLIYATCTVLRGENEAVVERLLSAHPDLEVMELKEVWGRERAEAVGDGRFLRLFPHVHGTDGFFAAILRKPKKS